VVALGPERWWPIRYRRADYLDGDEDTPLGTAVRDLVEARTGRRPLGAVRTLTQVRTERHALPIRDRHRPKWGPPGGRETLCRIALTQGLSAAGAKVFAFDDVQTYIQSGNVALSARSRSAATVEAAVEKAKALHVSPFMPMDQTYRLTCTLPALASGSVSRPSRTSRR
jgi:DUF1365 family protein